MTDDQQQPPPERELKDQRIPVMMTAGEVKAIDDWGFANRIRSRSEVIRRLIQAGLAYDPMLILDVCVKLGDSVKEVSSSFIKFGRNEIDSDAVNEFALVISDAIEQQLALRNVLFEYVRTSMDVVRSADIERALDRALDDVSDIDERINRIRSETEKRLGLSPAKPGKG